MHNNIQVAGWPAVDTGFTFAAPARYDSAYDLHRVRLGLNYKFGGGAVASPVLARY